MYYWDWVVLLSPGKWISFNLHIEWIELKVALAQSVHQSCGVPADNQAANSGFGKSVFV